MVPPSIRLPRYGRVSAELKSPDFHSKDDKRRRKSALRRFAPAFLLLPLLYLFLRTPSTHTPFLHPLPPPTTNTTFSPTALRQIPPYAHFVFGLSPTFGGKPFAFLHYVCLSSALVVLKPEVVFMHHVHEPTGFWWDEFVRRVEDGGGHVTRTAAREEQERVVEPQIVGWETTSGKGARTGVELRLVKQRDVTEVFGNAVEHFAHKADVIRLEALRDWGGVYLDTDVLVIKDMAPLYRHEAVLGMESQPNLDPALPPSGLCNAVILAKPFSSFIGKSQTSLRWLESYRTFDKAVWARHSVTMPWTLAHQFPNDVTVLNKFAFFWPLWHDDHLRVVHRSTAYRFDRPDPLAPSYDTQFTYHLWESLAWERYLSPYDADRVHNRGAKVGAEREEDGASDESSFSREARKYVAEATRERWRAAGRPR